MAIWSVGPTGDAVAQPPQGGGTPFSSIYRRPAVSPYQQLSNFANNPQAAGNLYGSMVAPMQQQQQVIQQIQQGRQLNSLNSRVQQIQRSGQAPQANTSIRPTGHMATFQNLSHFYPSAR